MAHKSLIEWTDSSWNPIRARNLKTGKIGWHCEHATTGCEFCYAEGINKRLGTGLPFKPGHRNDIEIFLDEKMLLAPLRWKRPRRIFVGSMTDLFADFVTDEMLDHIFAVMALRPQHTFQVLTKRAERMRDYCAHHAFVWCPEMGRLKPLLSDEIIIDLQRGRKGPLPNVWLGVSCERQEEADERITLLLQTPAAVRFISAEPLLGAIDLRRLCLLPQKPGSIRAGIHIDALHGRYCESGVAYTGDWDISRPPPPDSERRQLDWVIAGGESGHHARPMHPQWARDLRDQCAAAGVAYFFKQWGEYLPQKASSFGGRFKYTATRIGGHMVRCHDFEDGVIANRVGKKAAGRLLDGREHNDFPISAADHQSGSRADLVP